MASNKRLGSILRIAVSLLLVSSLALFIDPRKIGASLSAFRPIFLAPALGLVAAAAAASAAKWRLLLRAQGFEAGFGELFRAYAIGFFFNNFLPSSIGGDAARILVVGKRRGGAASIASSVVAERAIAAATLAGLGAATALASSRALSAVWPAFGLCFVIACAAAAVVVAGFVPGFMKKRGGKAADAVRSFAVSGALLRNDPARIALSAAVSVLFQLLVVAVNAVILAGLGIRGIGFADLTWVISAASALAMLPIGMNGYGLREGAYAFLLAPFAVPPEAAVSASVLFALCVSAFSLIGAAFLIADRRSQDRAPQEHGAPEVDSPSPERAESREAETGLDLSIIIPVLDDRSQLERLLARLASIKDASADYRIEIIVSDGGSADGGDRTAIGSGAILVRGPRGRGGQLARGAAAASGRLFLFLHADADIGDDFLLSLRAAIASGARWGCGSIEFDDRSPAMRLIAWGSRLRARCLSVCFGDQGLYCLRSLYDEVGGFPDIPLMEDVEISRRLSRKSRAHILSARIVASSRRFREGGVLQVFLRMKGLQLLHLLGVPARKLARLY
jgi:glycosyltransferase 2 family protein